MLFTSYALKLRYVVFFPFVGAEFMESFEIGSAPRDSQYLSPGNCFYSSYSWCNYTEHGSAIHSEDIHDFDPM